MNAYVNLVRTGLKSFLRDRQGLFWSFFFPLFFIFIFGTLVGGGGKDEKPRIHFAIGLVLPENSPMADGIAQGFSKVPVFDVHRGSRAEETEELKQGKRRVVVIVPAGLEQKFAAHEHADIDLLYDPSQVQTARTVVGIVKDVLAAIDQRVTGQSPLFVPKEQAVTADGMVKNPRQIEFFIPGILAMTVMQLGLFTAIPIINMREKGILKRYRATPLPRSTLVASSITNRLIIALLQTSVIVGIGVSFYHVRVQGWGPLIGLILLGVMTFICIGAVLSSLAKTQEAGVSMVQLVNFPMMFLTGIFFPVEIMPGFLQPLVRVLPATYLADAIRHVMVGMPSLYGIPMDIAALFAWLAIALLVAVRTFRWE